MNIGKKERKFEERKFWDAFATKYDRFIWKRVSESYNQLYAQIRADIKNSRKLLEIGTGTGLISFELSSLIPDITAIDISPKMIEIAKSKAKSQLVTNIKFQVGDAYDLHFKSSSFETIIASNVLHLLFKPEIALQEMRRVLIDDGNLIIPTYCHGENLKSLLISRLMGIFGFKARNRWSIKAFTAFIENNGCHIKESKLYEDKIPLLYVKATKR